MDIVMGFIGLLILAVLLVKIYFNHRSYKRIMERIESHLQEGNNGNKNTKPGQKN